MSGDPRCIGSLRPHRVQESFYQQMYAATDTRRVVAREHTSLLPAETRLCYESQFNQPDPRADTSPIVDGSVDGKQNRPGPIASDLL